MPKHDKIDLLAVALIAFILGYLARGGPNPCAPCPGGHLPPVAGSK